MKDVYYRNNRTSGQKNLRCFPTCGARHSDSTFCGKKLGVRMRLNKSTRIKIDHIYILGEFHYSDRPSDDPDYIDISANGGIHESDIQSRLKTRTESLHQFYPAKISSQIDHYDHYELIIYFNDECVSWHYGWKGNRYKQNFLHSFMISVLVMDPSQIPTTNCYYNLLGQFSSPSFRVLSLRRRAKKETDQEDVMPLNLEEQAAAVLVNIKRKQEAPFAVFHSRACAKQHTANIINPDDSDEDIIIDKNISKPIVMNDSFARYMMMDTSLHSNYEESSSKK